MSVLKSFLIWGTGNPIAQRLLQKNVQISQYLMGIGPGGGVETSGEIGILDLLGRKYNAPFCIFDVGANKGQYLQMAIKKLTINNLVIHCFEPSAYTFSVLKKNALVHDNVILNNVALGRE